MTIPALAHAASRLAGAGTSGVRAVAALADDGIAARAAASGHVREMIAAFDEALPATAGAFDDGGRVRAVLAQDRIRLGAALDVLESPARRGLFGRSPAIGVGTARDGITMATVHGEEASQLLAGATRMPRATAAAQGSWLSDTIRRFGDQLADAKAEVRFFAERSDEQRWLLKKQPYGLGQTMRLTSANAPRSGLDHVRMVEQDALAKVVATQTLATRRARMSARMPQLERLLDGQLASGQARLDRVRAAAARRSAEIAAAGAATRSSRVGDAIATARPLLERHDQDVVRGVEQIVHRRHQAALDLVRLADELAAP